MKNKYGWDEIILELGEDGLSGEGAHMMAFFARHAKPEFKPAFDALLEDMNEWLEKMRT